MVSIIRFSRLSGGMGIFYIESAEFHASEERFRFAQRPLNKIGWGDIQLAV